MKIDLKLDQYTREARLYPAIATSLPFLLTYHFYMDATVTNVVTKIGALVIGDVSVAAVAIYFLMEINRFISKAILENLYFSDELKFPTTELLLFKDQTYSDDFKQKVHKQVLTDFNIKLSSKTDEQRDEELARKKIVEAVTLIREKVKAGRLLLQHNIHYGAARNMIGGAFIGLAMSLVNIIIFTWLIPNLTAVAFSWILAGIYATVILSSRHVLSLHGKYYARRLFQEYLAS